MGISVKTLFIKRMEFLKRSFSSNNSPCPVEHSSFPMPKRPDIALSKVLSENYLSKDFAGSNWVYQMSVKRDVNEENMQLKLHVFQSAK